jgi:hypothetical protein
MFVTKVFVNLIAYELCRVKGGFTMFSFYLSQSNSHRLVKLLTTRYTAFQVQDLTYLIRRYIY